MQPQAGAAPHVDCATHRDMSELANQTRANSQVGSRRRSNPHALRPPMPSQEPTGPVDSLLQYCLGGQQPGARSRRGPRWQCRQRCSRVPPRGHGNLSAFFRCRPQAPPNSMGVIRERVAHRLDGRPLAGSRSLGQGWPVPGLQTRPWQPPTLPLPAYSAIAPLPKCWPVPGSPPIRAPKRTSERRSPPRTGNGL